MKNNYTRLIEVIRGFCLMVDHLEMYQRLIWLREMDHLLPQIEDGMTGLDLDVEAGFFVLPDLEHRFRMFCRLKSFLGDWDGYPLDGDCTDAPEEHTGSLADDFTDLYFELRRGLDLYEADPSDPLPALSLWHTGYALHWQEHLSDARHRLAELLEQQVN